jgi:hypothetical protein
MTPSTCPLAVLASRTPPGSRWPSASLGNPSSRKGSVVAAKSGEVLTIPGELFAREGFRPYEPGEFANVLAQIAG